MKTKGGTLEEKPRRPARIPRATKLNPMEQEQQKLVQVVQKSPDFIGIATNDGKLLFVNEAGQKMVGIESSEKANSTMIFDYLPADEIARFNREVLPVVLSGKPWSGEMSLRHSRTATPIPFEMRVFPICDAEGRVIAIANVSTDIRERKQMEAALKASEGQLRSMVDNAPYGIYRTIVEEGGKFAFVNPAMVKMLGYDSPEEVLALNLERQVYKTAADRGAVIAVLRSEGEFANLELHWRTKIGKELIISASGRLVRAEDGSEFIESIAEDITERRALERQLVQSQKMEAVGRLAGGIAHDFNNILNVISGYSDLAQEGLDTAHPISNYLVQIRTASVRAANLTRQLLMFSRQQVVFPTVLDLSTVVENMMKMLSRTIGEDVALSFRPEIPLGCVRADVGQIEQILMNLIVNARDAMPEGGQITIQTRNVELDKSYGVSHEPVIPGRYVMLSVSDTGCGMDETIQSHIFEPFFTTKEPGKGTGLGLATVYGIVKQSDAYVWVYSEPRLGATVKIYFPRVAEEADQTRATNEPAITKGTATILLVEDDKALRSLTVELLTAVGYRVLEAQTSSQAIEMAQDHAEPIDLLLTDVIMPVMGGLEVSTRLKALRPDIKVIFMSGYAGEALAKQMPLADDFVLIEKPFSRVSLLTTVDRVLRGSGALNRLTAPLH